VSRSRLVLVTLHHPAPLISLCSLCRRYHGFWMRRLFEVNARFGTRQDLLDLINAAHARGMFVMVDVVANHVGPVDLNFTTIQPFNTSDSYHPKCQITNWTNTEEVMLCRLLNLPDLNQTNPIVRSHLLEWVSSLEDMGFDGLRVDTVICIHLSSNLAPPSPNSTNHRR
jgi:alpha-amylase